MPAEPARDAESVAPKCPGSGQVGVRRGSLKDGYYVRCPKCRRIVLPRWGNVVSTHAEGVES